MSLFYSSLKNIDYILNCDYINKYNLKTIYKNLFIKHLTFQITYDVLLDITNFQESQFLNIYLYFIYFSSFTPYIKKIDNKVYMKIIYSKLNSINALLLNLSIENFKLFNNSIYF